MGRRCREWTPRCIPTCRRPRALASSSALLVAFTLALLEANGRAASFEELMEILPDGEQFVGTRGGGMDHAASLASEAAARRWWSSRRSRCATSPCPRDWSFLVAHSLQTAEKSGAAREEYNLRRQAGDTALARLGLAVPRGAGHPRTRPPAAWTPVRSATASCIPPAKPLRVRAAVEAMERGDGAAFGRLLLESHASLRDRLRVSSPALDRLVRAAMESGALGARLTGAGFGGCAVVLSAGGTRPACAAASSSASTRGRAGVRREPPPDRRRSGRRRAAP